MAGKFGDVALSNAAASTPPYKQGRIYVINNRRIKPPKSPAKFFAPVCEAAPRSGA